MHVLHVGEQHPVQADVRHGVHALKAQHLVGAVQHPRLGHKAGGVQEVVFHQGQGLVLVIPPEGVLQLAGGQQIGVDRARHRGGQLAHARHVQGPVLVQCLCNHTVNLPPGLPAYCIVSSRLTGTRPGAVWRSAFLSRRHPILSHLSAPGKGCQ